MLKIGFTGSRVGLSPRQYRDLRDFWRNDNYAHPVEAHHGDCQGADLIFHFFALTNANRVVVHPPDDNKLRAYCGDFSVPDLCQLTILAPKSYLQRNQDIVDGCDFLIACPEGSESANPRSGTWATIRMARDLHKPRWELYHDGSGFTYQSEALYG